MYQHSFNSPIFWSVERSSDPSGDDESSVVSSYEEERRLNEVLFVIDTPVGARIGDTFGTNTVSVEVLRSVILSLNRSQTIWKSVDEFDKKLYVVKMQLSDVPDMGSLQLKEQTKQITSLLINAVASRYVLKSLTLLHQHWTRCRWKNKQVSLHRR